MNPTRILAPGLIAILGCLASLQVPAAEADTQAAQRGLEIVQEADRRNSGWGDNLSRMTMILKNANGDTSEREIRTFTLEVSDDGDKSLTVFDRPRDLEGTAFLSFSHNLEPDDQWIYLPALRRVKRIASRNKSGPFMGSEFAYEDMASFEVEKYNYRFLREESLEGQPTYVVESYPRYENSGYTRLVTWFDQAEYRVQRIDYYDRKDSLLKTLRFDDYRQYLDQYWRAHLMTMVNHQTGKSTVLEVKEIEFHTGLDENDFRKNRLKRIR